jgi:hypothetical protein
MSATRRVFPKSTLNGFPKHNAHMGLTVIVASSVTISAIHGGMPWRLSANPFECSIHLDIRLVPGTKIEDVRRSPRRALCTRSEFGGARTRTLRDGSGNSGRGKLSGGKYWSANLIRASRATNRIALSGAPDRMQYT